jgi:hypothetical protein
MKTIKLQTLQTIAGKASIISTNTKNKREAWALMMKSGFTNANGKLLHVASNTVYEKLDTRSGVLTFIKV